MKCSPYRVVTAALTLFTCLACAFAANADTLYSRLGGLAYYDATTNLTWLANANENGAMTWSAANTWADNLTVDGVTGWRLPDTVQPDLTCGSQSGGVSYGYNCTGSEMGNLFYNVLGGTAGNSITTTHNANYNLFSNVQSGFYWSASEYAPDPASAWYFGMGVGYQGGGSMSYDFYAWAVHAGDVGAVPIPAAVWLFGSGLLGLVGVGAKRRR